MPPLSWQWAIRSWAAWCTRWIAARAHARTVFELSGNILYRKNEKYTLAAESGKREMHISSMQPTTHTRARLWAVSNIETRNSHSGTRASACRHTCTSRTYGGRRARIVWATAYTGWRRIGCAVRPLLYQLRYHGGEILCNAHHPKPETITAYNVSVDVNCNVHMRKFLKNTYSQTRLQAFVTRKNTNE